MKTSSLKVVFTFKKRQPLAALEMTVGKLGYLT